MSTQRFLFTSRRFTCLSRNIQAPNRRTFHNTAVCYCQPSKMRLLQPSTHATEPIDTSFISSLRPPSRQILWIGCCDSSVEETNILNLHPDEMLEHRNIGNMILDGDLSCETTVKHAVVDLQVGDYLQ